MSYESITFNDPNLIKRNLQNLRILHAYKNLHLTDKHILDFGGGNGQLLKEILKYNTDVKSADIFEPTKDLLQEAKNNLKGTIVNFYQNTDEIHKKYDFIFCLEVFEHLLDQSIESSLDFMKSLLAPNGKIIIGVPNELFLAALFKGLFRKIRRSNDYDASMKRILQATMGQPPQDRPMSEISPGMPYCYYHMGFDHRKLEKILSERFTIESIYGSPFKNLPLLFNSEVFFVLK